MFWTSGDSSVSATPADLLSDNMTADPLSNVLFQVETAYSGTPYYNE